MRYTIRDRDGWQWIDVRDPDLPNGKHRQSLKTRCPEEAKRLAEDFLASFSPTKRAVGYMSLREALLEVALSKKKEGTRDSYRAKVPTICRHFGEEANLLALESEEVDEYIAIRLDGGEGVKPHTVHKELTLLRQAWARFCLGRPSPVPSFDAEYVPCKRFLTVEEAGKLFAAAGKALAVRHLWFSLYAGAERGARKTLGWHNLDFHLDTVHLEGTKGETRDRVVPLHGMLREFLLPLDRNKPLLPRWGNTYRDMEKWCFRAQITYCTPTDLRRTFGSWLKQSGVDSKRVADLMGHTSTIMVDRVYGQLNAAAYKDAIFHLPSLPKLVAV